MDYPLTNPCRATNPITQLALNLARSATNYFSVLGMYASSSSSFCYHSCLHCCYCLQYDIEATVIMQWDSSNLGSLFPRLSVLPAKTEILETRLQLIFYSDTHARWTCTACSGATQSTSKGILGLIQFSSWHNKRCTSGNWQTKQIIEFKLATHTVYGSCFEDLLILKRRFQEYPKSCHNLPRAVCAAE